MPPAVVALRRLMEKICGVCAREWLEVVEWNKFAFDGMQNYYAATVHEEAHEYGKQVSRLTYATHQVAQAVQMCKKASKELQEQYRNIGSNHVSEYKEQMSLAAREVEAHKNENLRRGTEVKFVLDPKKKPVFSGY